MDMINTAKLGVLAHCEQTSPQWANLFQDVVDRRRQHGAGAKAPRVGERFPDFALPNEEGRYRTLYEILGDGPAVLSFNRGGWCPYCRRELADWALHSSKLASLHARFVAVVPESMADLPCSAICWAAVLRFCVTSIMVSRFNQRLRSAAIRDSGAATWNAAWALGRRVRQLVSDGPCDLRDRSRRYRPLRFRRAGFSSAGRS